MSKQDTQSAEQARRRPRVLTGVHNRVLDPKKRLTIPSVWRDALGGDYVYVMPDTQNHCLQLVPADMMEARLEKLQNESLGDKRLNALLSRIGEVSDVLEFDVQGRIRISDKLLAYAGLEGAVVLKGSYRMATIWPAERCVENEAVDEAGLDEAMSELGF